MNNIFITPLFILPVLLKLSVLLLTWWTAQTLSTKRAHYIFRMTYAVVDVSYLSVSFVLITIQVQCVIHHCVLYNNKNVSNHCSISTLSWVYAETGRKFKELTWAWSGLGLAIMLWQEKKRHLCGVTVAEWLCIWQIMPLVKKSVWTKSQKYIKYEMIAHFMGLLWSYWLKISMKQ